MTCPSAARIGAAIEQAPIVISSDVVAYPRLRTSASCLISRWGSTTVCGVMRVRLQADHLDRPAPGDPVDVQCRCSFEHGDVHLLTGRGRQVLHERQGPFPTFAGNRGKATEIPYPAPDLVPAVGTAGQPRRGDQLGDQAGRGGQRNSGGVGNLSQRQAGTWRCNGSGARRTSPIG